MNTYEFENKKYEELYNKAIEMLDDNDDLFVEMVDELDSYMGFADGFRCYPMDEITDLFYGVSIPDFLDKLTDDFNHRDNYFVDTIYGLESTDYPADVYHDNCTTDEVLDEVIEHYGFNPKHIWIDDSDFEEIIDELSDLDPDEEYEADDDDLEEVI